MSREIHIGTSGWNYSDWKNRFYPVNLSPKHWFKFYSKFFDTVEINNTFYQLPAKSVFRSWQDQAKKGFIYAIKANRYITHMKKLRCKPSSLKKFFQNLKLLKKHAGPILYQFPPGWNLNLERLEGFLSNLPKGYSHVFEFRNNSWFKDEVFALMAKHNVGFCIHDMIGVDCPKILTNDMIYLRFHGTKAKYRGGYSSVSLKKLAAWVKKQRFKSFFAYFNNDVNAQAVYDAQKFNGFFTG